MRFPRMTTRRWMLAVVLCCLPFVAVRYREARFVRLADEHEAALRGLGLTDLEIYLLTTTPQAGENPPLELVNAHARWEQTMQPWREFISYHGHLADKYRSAAARPWSWIDPDPPPSPSPSRGAVTALRKWIEELDKNSDPDLPIFEAAEAPKSWTGLMSAN